MLPTTTSNNQNPLCLLHDAPDVSAVRHRRSRRRKSAAYEEQAAAACGPRLTPQAALWRSTRFRKPRPSRDCLLSGGFPGVTAQEPTLTPTALRIKYEESL